MLNQDILFLTKKYKMIVSSGGRTLYRHDSHMGSVIEFNDGSPRKLLVLDAKYRAKNKIISTAYNDTSLHNCIYNYGYIKTGPYKDGDVVEDMTPATCESLTDETLNSLWWNDPGTSKNNTDVWLTQPDCTGAEYCRSVKVDGVGCDIPNFQSILRIYCEGVNLDRLDPTVKYYPEMRLSNWLNGSGVWCSSEFYTSIVWSIASNGGCFFGTKDAPNAVIPVLDL